MGWREAFIFTEQTRSLYTWHLLGIWKISNNYRDPRSDELGDLPWLVTWWSCSKMSFANIYKCYAKTLKSKASPSLFVYDRQHLIVCSLLFPPHIVTNHFISVLQLSNIFLMRNTIRRLPSVITMFTMLNHLVQKLLPENAPSTLAVRRVVWRVESRRLRWVIDHEAIWDTKLHT